MKSFNPFILRHLSIYYMLITCLCFATMGAIAKVLSSQINSVEIVFFRNCIGLVIILFLLYKSRDFGKGGHLGLLVFRGFIGAVGLVCFFYNISHIELGTAFTFQKTGPIFVAIFSYFALGEKLSKLGWSAIVIGFIGIIFVMNPNTSNTQNIDNIIGLAGGICMGLALTSVRKLRKYYSSQVIILSFLFFGTIPMAIILLFGSISGIGVGFENPNLFGWILVFIIGVLGYFYQLYMTKSYQATRKAGIPAATSYLDIVFSMFLGFMLGDALPTVFTLLGIIVIIFSGLLIAKEK